MDYEGLPLGREMDYETLVGLVMNSDRARLRRVYLQGLAITLANSKDEIPAEVAAAISSSDEQAKRLEFSINASRAARKAGF